VEAPVHFQKRHVEEDVQPKMGLKHTAVQQDQPVRKLVSLASSFVYLILQRDGVLAIEFSNRLRDLSSLLFQNFQRPSVDKYVKLVRPTDLKRLSHAVLRV
jgi:hypothetical protein